MISEFNVIGDKRGIIMNNQLTKKVEELEVLLLQPEVRKSAIKINELLADDFIEFGMSGK
jgi:hypothetical protein